MKDLKMEAKVVQNGLFEVTMDGIVYRLFDGTKKLANISYTSRHQKYAVVTAGARPNRKNYYVHRLVAEAFIPNPENKPQVNHIDGNTRNNHVSNLEWATAQENVQHAYRTGLIKITIKHYTCKICGEQTTSKQLLCGRCYAKVRWASKSKNPLSKKVEKAKAIVNTNNIKLTDRQSEIITMLANGMNGSQIASKLGITKQAVSLIIRKVLSLQI